MNKIRVPGIPTRTDPTDPISAEENYVNPCSQTQRLSSQRFRLPEAKFPAGYTKIRAKSSENFRQREGGDLLLKLESG
ncbi:hypothetical protein ACS0TY_035705 [Phlomoides rotata]